MSFWYATKQTKSCVSRFLDQCIPSFLFAFDLIVCPPCNSKSKWRSCVGVRIFTDSECTCFIPMMKKMSIVIFSLLSVDVFNQLLLMSFLGEKRTNTLHFCFSLLFATWRIATKITTMKDDKEKKETATTTIRLFLDSLMLSKYECIWHWHTKDILPPIACRFRWVILVKRGQHFVIQM